MDTVKLILLGLLMLCFFGLAIVELLEVVPKPFLRILWSIWSAGFCMCVFSVWGTSL